MNLHFHAHLVHYHNLLTDFHPFLYCTLLRTKGGRAEEGNGPTRNGSVAPMKGAVEMSRTEWSVRVNTRNGRADEGNGA